MQKTFLAIFLFSFSLLFAQTEWTFDKSHTNITFSVSHLVITDVDGRFNSFDGKITSVSDDFENAKVEFSADINSIDTDNTDRDNHLKSPDFFDAKKFPTLTFVSTSFKKVSGKNYKLIGNFTMKGITKEIELDVKFNGVVKDPWGKTKAGFKVSGELNRFDFGLQWSKALETGGLVVGDIVELDINVELTKNN